MRYPAKTGYQARRRARRAEVKAAFLAALLDAEDHGVSVNLADLALVLGCSASALRVMWHELDSEGKMPYPAKARRQGEYREVIIPDELEARVAAVRAAKIRTMQQERRRSLTDAELDEVLPL